MDYQTQLNNFLKKTRYNLLQFDILNNTNDPNNTLYKANLKLIIENKPLRAESNWESSIEEAKNQCSKRVYDFMISEPSFDINKPPEPKPILMSTGNRVIVRTSKSYETYILPIKYVNHRDLLIDISNGEYENQQIDPCNFLAIAKKNIILNLIQTQEIGNESPIYKIVPGCGLRVRKSAGGSYSCLVEIKKNGKQLLYHSSDVSEDSFYQTPISIFKVMSKSGIHYFPEQYSKPIEMNSFEKFLKKIGVEYNNIETDTEEQNKENQIQYMTKAQFDIRDRQFRKYSKLHDFKGVSENDCFREIKEYFKIQPNYIPNSKFGKKFILKNKQIISFSMLIIIMEIIECLSNNVNVRYDLSYYKYKLPRRYVRDKEFLIVLSNFKPEFNHVNSDEKLVVAKEDIKLDLVKLYGDSNEVQTFIIKIEDGFRVRKIGEAPYSASMVITKEDGKTILTYTNNSIPEESFKDYKVETIKVLSKHGFHFFPTSFIGRRKLSNFKKFKIIFSIQFYRLVSFFKNKIIN
ncbi:hypothetical protein ACTFIZ_000705 [Dictyostelium cf. discoideum]